MTGPLSGGPGGAAGPAPIPAAVLIRLPRS